jgi:hypothetical protein
MASSLLVEFALPNILVALQNQGKRQVLLEQLLSSFRVSCNEDVPVFQHTRPTKLGSIKKNAMRIKYHG